MKTIQFFRAALILLGILLSACAPAVNPAVPNVGSGKPVSDVIFTGVIESMNGDQWVINGQTITVDASVLRDGPFTVGDSVKVEASVAPDGSVTAQRVETPSVADAVETSTSTPEPTEAPTEVSTEAPDVPSVPGAATQPLVFDNNGNEAFGTVDSITATSITLNGETFSFAQGVEITGDVVAGAVVKLHFIVNADGSLSVTEVQTSDPNQISTGNGSEDGPNHDANDDHGGDDSSDDDGSDHDSNDDRGGDNSGSNSGSGGG